MVIKRGLKAVAGLLIVLGITACGSSTDQADSQEAYYTTTNELGISRDGATKLIQNMCKRGSLEDMAMKVYISHMLDGVKNNTVMRQVLALEAKYGVPGFCPEHEGKFDEFDFLS